MPSSTRTRTSLMLVLAFSLCSCAMQRERVYPHRPDGAASMIYQAQVSLGSCIFRPQAEARTLEAIGAALLASAVSQGINQIGKAIEEAGKGGDDRVGASRNVEVSAATFGPCLQIVRGWFHRGFANPDEARRASSRAAAGWAAPGAGGAPIDANRLALLWQRRMLLAAQPDFVFEARISPSALAAKPETRLLTLSPVYARLDRPASAPALSPSGSRDVAVFFAFHEASAEPADPRHAAGGLVLGRLDPGAAVEFPPLDSDTSATPNRAAGESKWFTLALGAQRKPMTITALVTEHRDPVAFLQFVAAVINGGRTPLANAIEGMVVPSERALAEESARTRDEAARSAFEDGLAKSMGAATKCAAGAGDALAIASDLRLRVRGMNRHARVLGMPEIDEELVPLDLDPQRVQAGCRLLRDALSRAISASAAGSIR